jgi:hypothetical protein
MLDLLKRMAQKEKERKLKVARAINLSKTSNLNACISYTSDDDTV